MEPESILKQWFVDYCNPTEKELRRWMEDPDTFEAMQDWDLVVGTFNNLHALARLANNDGPQRESIVHYLHVATTDSFNMMRDTIKEAIELVPDDAFEDVLEWRSKAEYLLENPKTFQGKKWFEYRYNTQNK